MEPTDSKKRPFKQVSSPSPSSSRPHKMARLETVTLPLSEQHHKELDEVVLTNEVLGLLPSDRWDIIAPYLLTLVVDHSDGLLNYIGEKTAKQLIASDDHLSELLKDAWEKRSFASIRNLAMLQAPSSRKSPIAEPSSQRGRRLTDQEDKMKAISSAWNTPYMGNCHELLYENINQMTRDTSYSNTVAIVQSSGTGKSRLVHEQSNLVFTIPFNLREETKDLSFPPPDSAVRNYLTTSQVSNTIIHVKAYYLAFLCKLFQDVLEELDSLYREKQKAHTYKDLASHWREHLEDTQFSDDGRRRKLYESVVKGAGELPESVPSDVIDNYRKNYEKEKNTDPFDFYCIQAAARAALEALLSSLDEYVESKGRMDADGAVKLVLYFDEAHVLNDPKAAPPNPDGKLLYDILCSCLNFFLDMPVFAIFLSTNPDLESVAPPVNMTRSARARDNVFNLQAPITEVPFDCARNFYVRPREYRLSDVRKVEFMSKFGRPLFWSMLDDSTGHRIGIPGSIIAFARDKLISNVDVGQVGFNPVAQLAVLDVRLMLDYEPRHQSIEAELVASHMRMAYSIPASRAYIRSGYSSEPILAEAAAQQMYIFRRGRAYGVVDIVMSNIRNGILDRGERGGLVARTLLTLAYDRAVERDHPPKNNNPPFYSQGCSTITFIEELFSEPHASAILDSVPDNIPRETTFREAFSKSQIRFTHFVEWKDDSCLTTEAMYAGFVRGMAIIRGSGEEVVDFLIPVLIWDELLCEEVMTGILGQIKRRIKAGTRQYEFVQESIGFFPKTPGMSNESQSRPYITLYMELGIQPTLSAEAKVPVKSEQPKISKKSSKKVGKMTPTEKAAGKSRARKQTPSDVLVPRQGRLKEYVATHPRYSIFAYGCSRTVYKVIGRYEKDKYGFLLATGDFLAEHPRQDDRTLGTLRRMEPFWRAGEDSFHWISSEYLRKPQDGDEEEYVVVGSRPEDMEEVSVHDDEGM